MRFRIRHRLRYRYDRPVFLEPTTLRLRPRSDCCQTLHHFEIRVDPEPEGQTESLDLDGTSLTQAWFSGLHSGMEVETLTEVETLRTDPYDFIINEESCLRVPVVWKRDLQQALASYLFRESPAAKVDRWAASIAGAAAGDTGQFLNELNAAIFRDIEHHIRETGAPLAPEEVLSGKAGACRDSAVLFMDACRTQGLPARFVSGYYYPESEEGPPQLHAWAEVYLPGGGWRGYDPSSGLAAAERHIALAAGPTASWAAPVTGAFRGTGAQASMDFDISMQPLPANPAPPESLGIQA
ncbi:MAG: transglutaminase N-terminal domain-containing protein [Nitrospinaceae bacterium]